MKSLHKAQILKLFDQHTYELEELRKKQFRELRDLLSVLELTKEK